MQVNSIGSTSFGLKFDKITEYVLDTSETKMRNQRGDVKLGIWQEAKKELEKTLSDDYCIYCKFGRAKSDAYDTNIYVGSTKNTANKQVYLTSVEDKFIDDRILVNLKYMLKHLEKWNQLPQK